VRRKSQLTVFEASSARRGCETGRRVDGRDRDARERWIVPPGLKARDRGDLTHEATADGQKPAELSRIRASRAPPAPDDTPKAWLAMNKSLPALLRRMKNRVGRGTYRELAGVELAKSLHGFDHLCKDEKDAVVRFPKRSPASTGRVYGAEGRSKKGIPKESPRWRKESRQSRSPS
jgi:hypothetical protein